jgi:hypothetical protein
VAIASTAAFSSSGSTGPGRAAAERRAEEVEVDPEQPGRCLAAHRVGYGRAYVTALGDVPGMAEAAHQLRSRLRDAADVPADLGRLA